MNLTVGWRLLCYDCGSNCDLHHCYTECDCDIDHDGEGECTHEGIDLCGLCIEIREGNNANKGE